MRTTKGHLWKAYMLLSKLKVGADMERLRISPTKLEQECHEFLVTTWEKESHDVSPDENDCVYSMTTTFSRGEYLGETTITTSKRMKTHVMKTMKKGKQKVNKFLRKAGVRRGIWTTAKASATKTTTVVLMMVVVMGTAAVAVAVAAVAVAPVEVALRAARYCCGTGLQQRV